MTTTVAVQPRRLPELSGEFIGTRRLFLMSLRRDRVRWPLFVLLFGAQVAASYASASALYANSTDIEPAVSVWNATPSLVAMFGPIYEPTIGALATAKLVGLYAALVGLVMVFHVVRHTRRDEDSGRHELLAATSAGRLAPLAAALINTVLLAIAIGAISALSLMGAGAPVPGSIAFGLGWTCAGLVFASLTAAFAEVAREARTAVGLGTVAIAIAYTLRAIGDLAPNPPGILSWLSPIGWSQQIRPFAGDRFWVALLPLAATVALSYVAVGMRRRRDLGAGLLPDRLGPAHSAMSSPFSLETRLNRGMLIGWTVGVLLFGLLIGSITDTLNSFFSDPTFADWIRQLGGQAALTDAYLALEMRVMAIAIAAVGIAVIDQLRREELSGRAEAVLSGPASRLGWASAGLTVAVAAVATLLLLGGLSVGVGAAASVGDSAMVGRLAAAGLAQIPAALVIVGLAIALFGIAPKWVPAAWAYLLLTLVIGELGGLWGLPQWVSDLSPFAHSPNLPGGETAMVAQVVLVLLAVTLATVGLVALRRRDLR